MKHTEGSQSIVEEGKRKTPSELDDQKITSESNDVSQSESTEKKFRGPFKVAKFSDTEMKCPECEYRTRLVNTLRKHLERVHRTTPHMAGVAFLCECGHECLAQGHSYSCHLANFTVIRKREGSVQTFDDAKTTPQCVLCPSYPKTPYAYVHHLYIGHKSSLHANGIYIVCSCGFEIRNYTHHCAPNKSKNCTSREYSLCKLEESTESGKKNEEKNGQDIEIRRVEEKERSEKLKEKKKRKRETVSTAEYSKEDYRKVEKIYRSIGEILDGEHDVQAGSIYRRIRKIATSETPLSVWKILLRKFERSKKGLKDGDKDLEEIYPSTQDMSKTIREKAYHKLTRILARRIRDYLPHLP